MSPANTEGARPSAFEIIFLACGVWLIGLGLYFVFVRPALLPEDLRFVGASLRELRSAAPELESWLRHVFAVMGGFMIGAGILTIYVVRRSPQGPGNRALLTLALAGVSTVGLMTVTNFRLGSDFKWLLMTPTLLWATGLLMFRRHE